MLKNQTINLKVVEKVAMALEELNNDVIYVGGAVVSLYVTDEGAEQPRPTKDIDIAVQISSYGQMDELRGKLALKKIYPAPTENVMYRYTHVMRQLKRRHRENENLHIGNFNLDVFRLFDRQKTDNRKFK
ncbi:hypothetical protein PBT90_05350 [Algoriphagus halophytocola]|uniref:Nucleotidyl transferase AbiEii/AbiGii toxin family protein n=1 Tax=Algoriphagus halophytocola TaxID=2991499 RepID=A0ABY6MI13_9BACT|nr:MULTISPECIES: hypothetical protein [unclassified Algoriphagus]UZD22843.1 hypothetical protein OM944_19610 [Algoriphagus sp. TR-M5]WBL44110.1 hypothetical protein PBT90_05350 [Algoriphagus sp. TR-M9]